MALCRGMSILHGTGCVVPTRVKVELKCTLSCTHNAAFMLIDIVARCDGNGGHGVHRTNAAHRNQSGMLGTFILEWDAGAAVCAKLFASKDSAGAPLLSLVVLPCMRPPLLQQHLFKWRCICHSSSFSTLVHWRTGHPEVSHD
jgi:hypothetical protein